MAYSNRDLVTRFVRGKNSGQASNMKIHGYGPADSLLVGYGWAIYAHCNRAKGIITVYPEWSSYSSTTNKHISMLRINSHEQGDGRPEMDKHTGDIEVTGGNQEIMNLQ